MPSKSGKKDPDAWCEHCNNGKHTAETCRKRTKDEKREASRRNKGESSLQPSSSVGQLPENLSADRQPSDQAGPSSATFPIDSTVLPRSSNELSEAGVISNTAQPQSASFTLPADSPALQENSGLSQIGEQGAREPGTKASSQRPRKGKGARDKKKAREANAQAGELGSTGTSPIFTTDSAAVSRDPDREITSVGRTSRPSSFGNGDKPSGSVAGPSSGEKATTPVQQTRPSIIFDSSMQEDNPRKNFGPKAKVAWDKKKSPEPEALKIDSNPNFRHREHSQGAHPLFDRKEPDAAPDSSKVGGEKITDVPGAFPESPPSSNGKPKAVKPPAAAPSTQTAKQSGDTNTKPTSATTVQDNAPAQAVSESSDSPSPEQKSGYQREVWKVLFEDDETPAKLPIASAESGPKHTAKTLQGTIDGSKVAVPAGQAAADGSKKETIPPARKPSLMEPETNKATQIFAGKTFDFSLNSTRPSQTAAPTSAKEPASTSDKNLATSDKIGANEPEKKPPGSPLRRKESENPATAGPRSGPGLTANPPRSSQATNSTVAAQGPETNSNFKPRNPAQTMEATAAGRGLSQIPPQQTNKRLAEAPLAPTSDEELDYGDGSDLETVEQPVSAISAQQMEKQLAKAPVVPASDEEADHGTDSDSGFNKQPVSPDLAPQPPRKKAKAVSRLSRLPLSQQQQQQIAVQTVKPVIQSPIPPAFGPGPEPSASEHPAKPAQATKPMATGQGSGLSSSNNQPEPIQATLGTTTGQGPGPSASHKSLEPEKATITSTSGRDSEPSASGSSPSLNPAQATASTTSRQGSEPSASNSLSSPELTQATKPTFRQESGSIASHRSRSLEPAQALQPTKSRQESGSSASSNSRPPQPAQATKSMSGQEFGSSASHSSPSPEPARQETGPIPPVDSPESVHATNTTGANQQFSFAGDGEQIGTEKAPVQNEVRSEESGSQPKASLSKSNETENHSRSEDSHRNSYNESNYDESDYDGSDYDGSDDDWSPGDEPWRNFDPIDLIPSQRGILKLLLWVLIAALMFLVGSIVGKHVSAIASRHHSTCFIAPKLAQRAFVGAQRIAWAVRAVVVSLTETTVPRPDFVHENGQHCLIETLTGELLTWGFLLAVSEAVVLIIISHYRIYHFFIPATFAIVLPLELGVCNGINDWLFSSTCGYLYGSLFTTLCSLAHNFCNLGLKQQLLSLAGVLFVLLALLGRAQAWHRSDEKSRASRALESLRRLRDIAPAMQVQFEAFRSTVNGLNARFNPEWRARWLAESNEIRRNIFLVLFGILLLLVVAASIHGPRFVETIRSMPSMSTKLWMPTMLSMPSKLSPSYWKTKSGIHQTSSVALQQIIEAQSPAAYQTSVKTITVTTTATEWHYAETKKVIPPPLPPTLSNLLERIANQSLELSNTALPLNPAPAALHGALREIRDAFPHYFFSEEMTKFTNTSDRKAEARSWLKLLVRLDGASRQMIESFKGASVGFMHWVATSAEKPLGNIERYEATGSARSFWRRHAHASCNLHIGLCGYPRDILRKSELEAFVRHMLDRVQYITDNGELTIQVMDRVSVLVEKIIRVNWEVNETFDIATQSKYAYIGGLKALGDETTWALEACNGQNRKIRYCLHAVFGLAQDMKKEVRTVLAVKDIMVPNLRTVVELLGNDSYGVDMARDWDRAGYKKRLVNLLAEAESAR